MVFFLPENPIFITAVMYIMYIFGIFLKFFPLSFRYYSFIIYMQYHCQGVYQFMPNVITAESIQCRIRNSYDWCSYFVSSTVGAIFFWVPSLNISLIQEVELKFNGSNTKQTRNAENRSRLLLFIDSYFVKYKLHAFRSRASHRFPLIQLVDVACVCITCDRDRIRWRRKRRT